MIKVKVRPPRAVDLVNKVRKTVDDSFAEQVQTEVVKNTILPLIASGTSPVDGTTGRRFRGYKDPKKYPGKRKERRPVSLYLSGEMLSLYVAEKISGVRLRLGISARASREVKLRAEANNVGTIREDGKEGIPARRFVPLIGETFRISVMRKIKSLYAKRIKSLLSSK